MQRSGKSTMQIIEREDKNHFDSIDKLSFDGINAGDVKKLEEAGISTCKGLLKQTKEQLVNITGLSEKKIDCICKAAEEVTVRAAKEISNNAGNQVMDHKEDSYKAIDKVTSEGINTGDVKKLDEAGISTCKGLLKETKEQLVNITGLLEKNNDSICKAAEEVTVRAAKEISNKAGNQVMDQEKELYEAIDKLTSEGINGVDVKNLEENMFARYTIDKTNELLFENDKQWADLADHLNADKAFEVAPILAVSLTRKVLNKREIERGNFVVPKKSVEKMKAHVQFDAVFTVYERGEEGEIGHEVTMKSARSGGYIRVTGLKKFYQNHGADSTNTLELTVDAGKLYVTLD